MTKEMGGEETQVKAQNIPDAVHLVVDEWLTQTRVQACKAAGYCCKNGAGHQCGLKTIIMTNDGQCEQFEQANT